MAIFRIEIGAGSEAELTRAMSDVPDAVSGSPDAEWLLAGRDAEGSYVLLGGDEPAPLTRLLEQQGLEVSGVSEVSHQDYRNGTFALSPDEVWCPRHRQYHSPPAHDARP